MAVRIRDTMNAVTSLARNIQHGTAVIDWQQLVLKKSD